MNSLGDMLLFSETEWGTLESVPLEIKKNSRYLNSVFLILIFGLRYFCGLYDDLIKDKNEEEFMLVNSSYKNH